MQEIQIEELNEVRKFKDKWVGPFYIPSSVQDLKVMARPGSLLQKEMKNKIK